MVGLDKELNRNRIVNKSHAAAYAVISVRTAWLKKYHPVVFWTETLNSVLKKADQIRKYLYCAQKHGIKILPPSVNRSAIKFNCDGNNIRIGLSALRDLGKFSHVIVKERENGDYKDFKDLINRCKPGKKAVISLAHSGSCDDFNITRRSIIENFPKIESYYEKKKKYDSWADFDELNEAYDEYIALNLDPYEEYEKQEKLLNEYNFAGMYVSEHPLDEHIQYIEILDPDFIVDLHVDLDDVDSSTKLRRLDKKTTVVGIIKNVETKITRKGERMIVGTIEDKTSDIRFTVFSGTLEEQTFNSKLLADNTIVIMDGVRKVNEFGSQIIVNAVSSITTCQDRFTKIICTTDMEHYKDIMNTAFSCKDGNLTVIMHVEFGDRNVGTLVMDHNQQDKLYQAIDPKQPRSIARGNKRFIDDPNNLKVDISAYLKLKEVSKNIRVR